MTGLSSAKDKIKVFYGQFYGVLNIIIKFALMFCVLYVLNMKLGYSAFFSNIFIILIMSLIASILGLSASVIIASVALLGNAFALGADIGVLTLMVVLVLLILFVFFVPEDSVATILTPLAITVGVPAIIPICFGLKRNPASLAAICPGVIIYGYVHALAENAEAIKNVGSNEYLTRIKLVTDGFMSDKLIILAVLAVSAVLVITYAIRKFKGNHSWTIAIIVGCILYAGIVAIGAGVLKIDIDLLKVLIGVLAALIISFVFKFFIFDVDYKRAENFTFEDDEYYYYVKAIPKFAEETDKEDEEDDAYFDSEDDDEEFEYVDADEEEDDDYEYFDVEDDEDEYSEDDKLE